MNTQINLGVIVPFYNEQKFLDESVSRLLKIDIIEQIILVDDCSSDNSYSIAKNMVNNNSNISLTQTLSRTFITSITTLLVLAALFFRGGELIHGFATALLFGVFVGTYSSIYVASLVALALGISREDLMPEVIEKEGEDQEQMTPK